MVDAEREAIERVETFAEQAHRRAELEREAVEWAIDELETRIDAIGVDLEPLLEHARRGRETLPDRHERAYETMADVFDVDPDVYEAYVFAFQDLTEALAEGRGRSERHPQGCTNVLVTRSTLEREDEAAGPLVLKNRDIAGRGVRPKSIVEQPPIDDYHGFVTVDTCGTISIFKAVNDQGLVAANTYIERERDDIDPEDQLRNGTVIRIIVEECATVDEAREVLESYPTRRLSSQTLFLADGTDGVLLEVDPVDERIAVDDDPVVVRTNHFVNSSSTQTESSTVRRERAQTLLDRDDRLEPDDLWTVAQDHAHGPGDDSICRHPEPETDEPHAFGQLTTASTAIFRGGSPAVDVALGNPCERERTRCVYGEDVPADLRTGAQWLELR